MSLIIRILLFLLFITFLRWILAMIFPPLFRRTRNSGRASTGTRTIQGTTVKDPHCGMYVATDLAVPADTGKGRLFFCSKECRDAYLEKLTATVESKPQS